jgi:hypothetical protein
MNTLGMLIRFLKHRGTEGTENRALRRRLYRPAFSATRLRRCGVEWGWCRVLLVLSRCSHRTAGWYVSRYRLESSCATDRKVIRNRPSSRFLVPNFLWPVNSSGCELVSQAHFQVHSTDTIRGYLGSNPTFTSCLGTILRLPAFVGIRVSEHEGKPDANAFRLIAG